MLKAELPAVMCFLIFLGLHALIFHYCMPMHKGSGLYTKRGHNLSFSVTGSRLRSNSNPFLPFELFEKYAQAGRRFQELKLCPRAA